ncbi:MAG: glycine cleavage system protein GcvH [Alphaproteobacteria bacterium]|nr:glycine cleavage system protein GcvH [Alphaproteobacteria bacterium]
MSERKYTEDHEWVDLDGDIGTVGITDYAQEQLGDVVFVELPDVGKTLSKGDEAAVIESVKAAAEIYAPVDGEITEVNAALNGDPSLVNADAGGKGWFVKLRIADASALDGLMDEAGYTAFVDGLS